MHSPDRVSLLEHFRLLADDALLAEYRSGGLTDLAKEVVVDELRQRKIELPDVAHEPADQPQAEVIGGDLALVARRFTAAEAHMLRSLLEAEGIPAVVTDHNAQNVGWIPTGGVRVLVPEPHLARAAEVVDAVERGDYRLDDRSDVA